MPDKDAQMDEPEAATTAQRPDSDAVTELSETKDRLLRVLADQENVRSQARRDIDNAVIRGAGRLATDLLASVDSLERAIASVPAEKRADPAVETLLVGVEATRRAMLDALAKHGIRRFDPAGEEFDPHRHEASFEVQDATVPAGTVTQVIQPGYLHNQQLLRPALVGVSRKS